MGAAVTIAKLTADILYITNRAADAAAAENTWPVVRHSLQLVGFQGDEWHFNHRSPMMRWTGHLGMRYRNISILIYGFSPDSRYEIGVLVPMLLNGKIFKGRVKDDSRYFEDATRSTFGFVFVFWDVPWDYCAEADCGLRLVQEDAKETSKRYSFPPSAPQRYRNITSYSNEAWGKKCFNCGTYPASVGVKIPDEGGMFNTYIPAIAAQRGAFCRCYTQGHWQNSKRCDRERERNLFEVCIFEEPPVRVCSNNEHSEQARAPTQTD